MKAPRKIQNVEAAANRIAALRASNPPREHRRQQELTRMSQSCCRVGHTGSGNSPIYRPARFGTQTR